MQHNCYSCPGFREGHCGAGPEGAWSHGESAGDQAEGNWDWRAEIPAKEVINGHHRRGSRWGQAKDNDRVGNSSEFDLEKGQSSKSVESTGTTNDETCL